MAQAPFIHLNQTAGRTRKQKRKLIIRLVFLLLACLIAADAFWIEPVLMLTVARRSFTSGQVPENWSGRTIAFFTDTHLGRTYPPERLERAAALIEREKPDLIVFGGDLIDSRTPDGTDYDKRIISVLSQIKAPLGQFAVAGNHDNRLNAEYDRVNRLFSESGFILLDNQSVCLDGLWLAGLAESYFGKPDLDLAFSPDGLVFPQGAAEFNCLQDEPLRVLLMHQPDYAAKLRPDSADLAFSGHSHNGQVTFFGYPILTVHEGSEYPYGQYVLPDGRQLIVSRGLGTVGVPARFFAPPEIVLVTLRQD